jgi:hypothetical protein
MKMLKHFAAWLTRKSRARERRKLYRELIKIGHKREIHPERQGQYFAEVSSIIARLDVLTLADDIASVEARMKPAPLWPGLPTGGLHPRAGQEDGKASAKPISRAEINSRAFVYVPEAVAGVVLTAVILLHLLGSA